MQAVLHHGAGQEADADQQVAGLIRIVLEQLDVVLALGTGDAHQGEQQNREQCGERDRHCLSDPEDHHQHRDRQHALCDHRCFRDRRQAGGGRHEADDQHRQNTDDKADLANRIFTHRISS